jgi:2-keto-3-deoxy-L-rhamnonate aldolase RhmA
MFDPNQPTFKRRLLDGDDIGFFWFALGSPSLVEIAIANGVDAVVLDLQHGLFERRDLEAAIAVVPPAIPCLVRIEDDSAAAVSRALDAGAEGVLVPLVETGEQAARVAHLCHYPPRGSRSGGGVRPLKDFMAYRRAADAGVTVGAMIETRTGVENASAIAAAVGVDYVFIGSGDLALSLGVTPQDTQPLEAAIRAVLEACAAAGKPCGIFTMNAADARLRTTQGFSPTVAANDLSVVMAGFAASHAEFARGRKADTASGTLNNEG